MLQRDRIKPPISSLTAIPFAKTSPARDAARATSGETLWPNGSSQLTVLDQWQEGEVLPIEVVARRTLAACPDCGAHTSAVHERRLQQKQDLGADGKRVILLPNRRRFRCRACDKVFTEPDDVCGWRRRTTARFRRYLREQATDQSIKRIARLEMDGFAHRGCPAWAGLGRMAPVERNGSGRGIRAGRRHNLGGRCAAGGQ